MSLRPLKSDPDVWLQEVAYIGIAHPKLLKLAYAIMVMEGWRPGTVAYRLNNPGNLRRSHLAVDYEQTASGEFAVFGSFYHGLYALLWDLSAKCMGQTTTGLGPNSSLRELIKIYAPAIENDPAAYHASVISSLDLAPDAPDPKLRDFIHG
jgi:hypothetical protein